MVGRLVSTLIGEFFCWRVDVVGWLIWSVSPSTVGRSVGRFLRLVGEFVGGSINRGCRLVRSVCRLVSTEVGEFFVGGLIRLGG